jgi:hypothetical protein
MEVVHGYSPTGAATTQIVLTDLDGFSGILAGRHLGIVSDAALYLAFGSSPVTIDTSNDVFIPANAPTSLLVPGKYLGLRKVTAGTATVRIWSADSGTVDHTFLNVIAGTDLVQAGTDQVISDG